MGVGVGLYMYDVVVKKFTFAISSTDEFLSVLSSNDKHRLHYSLSFSAHAVLHLDSGDFTHEPLPMVSK